MKVKYSLIPFIPITIAMIVLKTMGIFAADSDGFLFGMDNVGIAYTVILMALVIFLIALVFNIFDKKTAPVYIVEKNPIAGISAAASGLLIAAVSLYNLIAVDTNSNYYIISLIAALMAVPAAVAMILMCRIHFSGKTEVSSISFFYIFPALWSCVSLVNVFLDTTRYSVSSIDMSQLFCYIFLTLYFFSHSMIMARIKDRNPVKACYIYGLPAASILLAHGVYLVCSAATGGITNQSLLLAANYIVLAIYIISFVTELSFNSLVKDEVEIIGDIPESSSDVEANSETEGYITDRGYDDVIFAANRDEQEKKELDIATDELDDFIMTYSTFDNVEKKSKKSAKKAFTATGEFFTSEGENILDSTPALKQSDKKSVDSSKTKFEEQNEKAPQEPVEEIKEPAKQPEKTVEKEPEALSVQSNMRNKQPQKPKTERKFPTEIEILLQELDSKK